MTEISRNKFLIIRLGAIGDLVHSLPVAGFLRDNFEDSQIDWVVDEKCAQLIENNPLINNCLTIPLGRWKRNWLLLRTIREICAFNKLLREEHYDWAFDLHGMFKSLVIFAFCGAKKRVGYSDYREFAPLGANVLIKPKSKRPHVNYHVMDRNLDLPAEALGLNKRRISIILPRASRETVKKIDELLAMRDIKKPVYVFAPATTWKNKHWDVEEWKKLYEMTKNEANIVFSGVKKDLGLIEKIVCGDENAIITAGETNLEEYIEVLRRADIVVSPDSSASHLAFALQCERERPAIVTLFCATSKHTYGPRGEKSTAFPLGEPVCAPCFKRRCKLRGEKHQVCTRQTSAREVYAAIKKLIIH